MTPAHRAGITLLEQRGFSTKGFCRTLLELLGTHQDEEYTFVGDTEVSPAAFKKIFNLRPDAYLIDRENSMVTVVEVEDTHPVKEDRLFCYAVMIDFFDYYEFPWQMELKVMDARDLQLKVLLP